MENTKTKFEVGSTYMMGFIGDSELKPHYKCTKRTASFATFARVKSKEEIRRKINTNQDNIEYVIDGNYSMAPSIYANKIVK